MLFKVGCTKKELEKLIEGDEYTKEVRDDEERAYAEGVHAVPYFKINGEVINGCASKEEMKKVLLKVLNITNSNKNNNDEL